MPKRPPTPPPGDDEPKYLTVCYPYPPQLNMEMPGEVIALVRWLACCMGRSQDLYAVFHKPSTSSVVLIEVNRHYPDFRKLLGAHKWSDFVLNPGVHHDKVTRIYFSTLANVRAVEKAGWKRIFIDDDWFKGFIPNNHSSITRYIKYPYPRTTHCDTPTEDHINYKLCRPIPLTLFEIRLPTPPPVPVGSSAWIAQKEQRTVASPRRGSYASASTLLPPGAFLAEPRKSQIVMISPPNMSRPSSLVSLNNSTSNGPLGYNGVDPADSESSENHQSGSTFIEDFGTLTINPPTVAAKESLCITHQIVCKEQVCGDYKRQLKRIERERLKEELAASGGEGVDEAQVTEEAGAGEASHSSLAVSIEGGAAQVTEGAGAGEAGEEAQLTLTMIRLPTAPLEPPHEDVIGLPSHMDCLLSLEGTHGLVDRPHLQCGKLLLPHTTHVPSNGLDPDD
ncbi:hypothetical protein BU17DRAFT_67931 [Hysterangium stoloniferum]|nr:hypothetical protein BU17DRAFT_67931 [Hysterangium stoloniferum]